MFLVKLIFLALCCLTVYGSESSEELQVVLESGILQDVIKAAYDEDKLGAINELVHDNEFPNITVIGTQNVYGPKGDIEEIRTIELHIPRFGVVEQDEHDDDEDDDDENDLEVLRKLFDLLSKLGLDLEVYAAEYNKQKEPTFIGYLSKDVLLGYFENIYLINQTIEVDNIAEVNEKIKLLQADSAPVAVLKFDDQGHFIAEKSVVVPEYIVSVVNEEGSVSLSDLEIGEEALANIFLKYQHDQDEVPSKLAEYVSEKYPEYDVFVSLKEPEAWYVNYDYKVDLRYDLTSWDSSEEIIYSIFLNKKKQATAAAASAEAV